VRQAIVEFFAALDARVRDLAVIEANGGLELQDSQGRAIDAGDLEELGIIYYAPISTTENPAAERLFSAIERGDVETARQAIADGASLEFLPDLDVGPLQAAFDDRCPGDWRGVAKVLVEAGAPINGYAWEMPPICSAISPLDSNREESVIKRLEAILALGANINCPARGLNQGSTPLHLAVLNSFPEVVRFLIIRGASLEVRNERGLTSLELAESMARDDPDVESAIGDDDDAVGRRGERRKPTPIEFFATLLSGTPKDQAKRRARVVKLLRDASGRGNRG
jgi:hypothetical protein